MPEDDQPDVFPLSVNTEELPDETANIPAPEMTVKRKVKKRKLRKGRVAMLAALAVLAPVLYITGTSFRREQMAASARETKDRLVLTFHDESDIPVLEAGEELTYTETDDLIDVIPDQLRRYIRSIPGDSEITLSDIDISKTGEQYVIVGFKTTDRFGQTVTNHQTFPVEVADTRPANIELEATSITLPAGSDEDALRKNVKAVNDPVFGEYAYSDSGEERTWRLDVSGVDLDHAGDYKVRIVVNDNGNMIEASYDLKIEGNIEDVIEQTSVPGATEETEEETDNGPDMPVYIDENGSLYVSDGHPSAESVNVDACINTYGEWVKDHCEW